MGLVLPWKQDLPWDTHFSPLKAGYRTGVHASPRCGSPSTSSTGCESRFGAELLCAHLSPRPGSPALPPSELGLGFPWLLQLEWKSALVCQPSPELGSAHTAWLWLSTVPTGTQIHAGSSSWEPPEGRCWDRHQEFSSIPSFPVPRGTLTLPEPHPTSHWGTEPSPCSSASPPHTAVHIWDQNLWCAARSPRPRLLLARGELGSAPR